MKIIYLTVIFTAAIPTQVFAMHTIEGFLPLHWALIWWLAVLPFMFLGVVQIKGITEKAHSLKMLLAHGGLTTADDQAEAVIEEINPEYVPWFNHIWEPPGDEIENLLFILQGALGAGVSAYGIGYYRGRREK